MIARRFDIGEELLLPLAHLVWAWEEKRDASGLPARAAMPLLRLPGGGRTAFVLAPDPRGEGVYESLLVGADCPAEIARAPLADPAFEAWLSRTPMTLETESWCAILVPLAHADTHVILGLVVAKEIPAREAA